MFQLQQHIKSKHLEIVVIALISLQENSQIEVFEIDATISLTEEG